MALIPPFLLKRKNNNPITSKSSGVYGLLSKTMVLETAYNHRFHIKRPSISTQKRPEKNPAYQRTGKFIFLKNKSISHSHNLRNKYQQKSIGLKLKNTHSIHPEMQLFFWQKRKHLFCSKVQQKRFFIKPVDKCKIDQKTLMYPEKQHIFQHLLIYHQCSGLYKLFSILKRSKTPYNYWKLWHRRPLSAPGRYIPNWYWDAIFL